MAQDMSDARTGEPLSLPNFPFTFRFVEAPDVPPAKRAEMIELLRVAFNGGPSWFSLDVEPLEHLRWKADDIPGSAQAELIEDGERLVGLTIALRRRFLVRGKVELARDGVELCLAPDVQGRGVQTVRLTQIRQVWRQLNPDVSFQLYVTTHPASFHLRDRRGTTPFANYLELHTKALSMRRWLALQRQRRRPQAAADLSRTRVALAEQADRRTRLLRPVGQALRLAASSVPRVPPRVFGGEISTVAHMDEQADALWGAVAPTFDFIQVRDAQFLNWRFADSRGGPFIIRAATERGALVGYSALRAGQFALEIGDLLTLPERPEVVDALVRDAIDVGRTRGSAVVQSWLPHVHPYHEAFRRSGFFAEPATVGLGYESWRSDLDLSFLDDPQARVHFMKADTDHL